MNLYDFIKSKKVYHVANPDVAGTVVSWGAGRYVNVVFDEPVNFSGNPLRGNQTHWSCNSELLFETPDEAKENHDPERAKAQSISQEDYLRMLDEINSRD